MRSNTVLPITFALVVGLAAGTLGGYALGRRQGHSWGIDLLRQETTGMLSLHVETLTQLRLGEPELGLAALEESVDRAVTTITAAQAVVDSSPATNAALGLARTYRSRFPARGPLADDVDAVLAEVSDNAAPQTPALALLRRPMPPADASTEALGVPFGVPFGEP